MHGLKINALRAALAEPEPRNQCGETCERAKLCAVCAGGLAEQEPADQGNNVHSLLAWIIDECVVYPESPDEKAFAKRLLDAITHPKSGYIAPQPAKREPLTDEQIDLMAHNDDEGDWNHWTYRDCWYEGYKAGARAIERAHGIGGQP